MPEVVFPLDSTKKFTEQEKLSHNRWHPDIPAAVTVKQGDSVPGALSRVVRRCHPATTTPPTTSSTPRWTTVHVLSGPIAVEGAKPGDLLIVDILDVGPIPQEDSGPLAGQGWGYTGIFPKLNGGGFLTDQFPDAYKAIWDFSGSKSHFTARAARRIHRHRAPRADGHRTLDRAAGEMEHPRGRTDRHRPRPGAAAGPAARTARRDPRRADRGCFHQGGWGGGPHRAAARERRQSGHQEPHQGQPGVLSGVRRRGEPLGRRLALLPRRRRDHLLGGHRDGWVHRPARRRHPRWHGHLRCERERNIHARQHRPAVLRMAGLLRDLGDPRR